MISQIAGPGALYGIRKLESAKALQAPSSEAVPDSPGDSAQISGAGHASRLDMLKDVAVAKQAASIAGGLPEHVPGEVIVKLKPEFAFSSRNPEGVAGGFAQEYGAEVTHRFDIPEAMFKSFNGEMLVMKLPAGVSTAQAMALMARDERVEYAASNDVVRLPQEEQDRRQNGAPAARPGDLNGQLWGLNNEGQTGGTVDADIDAPEGWALQTGKPVSANGPLIAIIDTGINYNHEALQGNIWTNPGEVAGNGIDDDGNGVIDDLHGFNAAGKNGNPLDDNDHGSHCAGTIGANGSNSQGLYGVMHKASLMGVKFLTSDGSGTLADAVDSLLYATRMGARITSNSWGGGGFNQALYDAFKSSPALHVIAAGNESNDNDARPAYPASYDLPNVISVAAIDHNDQLADFSNYGATTVDLAAPGVDILSSTSGRSDAYKVFSGTSMATPHVSGAAGLIASQFPGISNEQLKARLLDSVDRKPQLAGKTLSGGRLNIANALEVDNLAPGAPSDFGVSKARAGRVTLGFTAPGDDGGAGQASAYVLKMSNKPIVDGKAARGEVSFDSLPALRVASPGAPGSLESMEVKTHLSSSEQKLYFALKVLDNVGNASPLQMAVGTVPAAMVAFEDKVDGRTGKFRPDRPWSQVEEPGRGKVWTDSPRGKYRENLDTSLTSKTISLAGMSGSTLVFDARTDLEKHYDNVYVEVAVPAEAKNGKLEWQRAETLNGTSDWSTREVDLSAYDGKDVQLRFRMRSDSSVSQDGIYLDNILVAGAEA
jgi:subtilisin family serine protease